MDLTICVLVDNLKKNDLSRAGHDILVWENTPCSFFKIKIIKKKVFFSHNHIENNLIDLFCRMSVRMSRLHKVQCSPIHSKLGKLPQLPS